MYSFNVIFFSFLTFDINNNMHVNVGDRGWNWDWSYITRRSSSNL